MGWTVGKCKGPPKGFPGESEISYTEREKERGRWTWVTKFSVEGLVELESEIP